VLRLEDRRHREAGVALVEDGLLLSERTGEPLLAAERFELPRKATAIVRQRGGDRHGKRERPRSTTADDHERSERRDRVDRDSDLARRTAEEPVPQDVHLDP